MTWRRGLRRIGLGFQFLLAAGPALLLAGLILALRPLVLIRLAPIRASRLGHFLQGVDLYLSGPNPPGVDLLFLEWPRPPCNQTALGLVKAALGWRLAGPRVLFWLAWRILARFAPSHTLDLGAMLQEPQRLQSLGEGPAHFRFTPRQLGQAREWLTSQGLDRPYVTLFARDRAYMETTFGGSWAWQDYRDADIASYGEAASALASRGLGLARVGRIVAQPFRHPQVFDYATSPGRSDFRDVALVTQSKFLVADTSGVFVLCEAFRRPCVLVNSIPMTLMHFYYRPLVLLPKLLWLEREGRYLTFSEMLQPRFSRYRKEEYDQLGLKVVDNSPEDIRDASLELDDRLDGRWQPQEADDALQGRFWELFRAHRPGAVVRARMSARFLRRHQELLA